jgi:hypothetical protein
MELSRMSSNETSFAIEVNTTSELASDSNQRFNLTSSIETSTQTPHSTSLHPINSSNYSFHFPSLSFPTIRTLPLLSSLLSTATSWSPNITTTTPSPTINHTQYTQLPLEFQPYDYTDTDYHESITTPNKQTANMTQNYRENIEFGDTMKIKEANTIRLYFQNIRGCKKNNSWKDWQYATKYLHDNQVDIIGYAETNLFWDAKSKQEARQHTAYKYKKCVISTSRSIDGTDSYHQQGGTATIVTQNYTGRITSDISDKTGLGRWSGVRMRRKNGKHLSILTAYCPHIDTKWGKDTCYQQQWRILNEQGTAQPEPRKQMLQDLLKYITELREMHDEIILLWDANGDLKTNKEITQLLNESPLHNLMSSSHDTFSTYLRGKKIIDHIWGTDIILQNIRRNGFSAFHENAWYTDHRALYIDIDTNSLFDTGLINTIPNSVRIIKSSNKKHLLQFLTHIEKGDNIDTMLQCSNDLLDPSTPWDDTMASNFEQLDQRFTAPLLNAEKSLEPIRNLPWSPDLTTAFQIYTYWRKVSSLRINRYKITEQMKDLENQLGDQVFFGNWLRHPLRQLKSATINYRICQKKATELREVHLHLRQDIIVGDNNAKRAKAIKSMRATERRNRMYNTIRKINKPNLAN